MNKKKKKKKKGKRTNEKKSGKLLFEKLLQCFSIFVAAFISATVDVDDGGGGGIGGGDSVCDRCDDCYVEFNR